MSKVCTKCAADRIFKEFNKAKLGAHGLKAICKKCQAKESSARYELKKHDIIAYGKQYRENNKDNISIKRSVHTQKNKKRLLLYGNEWRLANPGKSNARTARRRNFKRNATPPWLTEAHLAEIQAFYVESARITKETGIPHEVDHIVPVMGKNVTGLHVPWNLRVITAIENRRKGRKF